MLSLAKNSHLGDFVQTPKSASMEASHQQISFSSPFVLSFVIYQENSKQIWSTASLQSLGYRGLLPLFPWAAQQICCSVVQDVCNQPCRMLLSSEPNEDRTHLWSLSRDDCHQCNIHMTSDKSLSNIGREFELCVLYDVQLPIDFRCQYQRCDSFIFKIKASRLQTLWQTT